VRQLLPEPVEDAWAEAVEDDVVLLNQAQESLPSRLALEVEADAPEIVGAQIVEAKEAWGFGGGPAVGSAGRRPSLKSWWVTLTAPCTVLFALGVYRFR
jgi:hypothetical protein